MHNQEKKMFRIIRKNVFFCFACKNYLKAIVNIIFIDLKKFE